jgi:hypothetical protein
LLLPGQRCVAKLVPQNVTPGNSTSGGRAPSSSARTGDDATSIDRIGAPAG